MLYLLRELLVNLNSTLTHAPEKVEQPMKWKIGFPSIENLDVPSGIRPAPCVDRIAGQRFVFGEAQKMHDFSLCSTENILDENI